MNTMTHQVHCNQQGYHQTPRNQHQPCSYRVGLGRIRASHPATRHVVPALQHKHTEPAVVPSNQSHSPWQPLNQPAIWQGTEAEALSDSNSCFGALSPTWKVMLLSDGSVTRHLQLLTGQPVHVECLEMVNIGDDTAGLPSWSHLIHGPRVQRTVLLRTKHSKLIHGAQHAAASNHSAPHSAQQGSHSQDQASDEDHASPPLVYAVSWWDAAEVDKYLVDKSQPIWVSLSQGKVELHRKVLGVQHGHNAELEKLLGCSGPFWGRHYLFTHDGGKPLTLIYEVFSPRLAQYLGPQRSLRLT